MVLGTTVQYMRSVLKWKQQIYEKSTTPAIARNLVIGDPEPAVSKHFSHKKFHNLQLELQNMRSSGGKDSIYNIFLHDINQSCVDIAMIMINNFLCLIATNITRRQFQGMVEHNSFGATIRPLQSATELIMTGLIYFCYSGTTMIHNQCIYSVGTQEQIRRQSLWTIGKKQAEVVRCLVARDPHKTLEIFNLKPSLHIEMQNAVVIQLLIKSRS